MLQMQEADFQATLAKAWESNKLLEAAAERAAAALDQANARIALTQIQSALQPPTAVAEPGSSDLRQEWLCQPLPHQPHQ